MTHIPPRANRHRSVALLLGALSLAAGLTWAQEEEDRPPSGLPSGIEIETTGQFVITEQGQYVFDDPVSIRYQDTLVQADRLTLTSRHLVEGEGNILLAWGDTEPTSTCPRPLLTRG